MFGSRARLQILAVVVVTVLSFAPASLRAQEIPEPEFDPYYAGAVTAGIIVGSTVAVVATEGLILPVLSAATGGAAAGAGQLLTGAAGVFGAVCGALYADQWYEAETSWISVSW